MKSSIQKIYWGERERNAGERLREEESSIHRAKLQTAVWYL
jgi:hypothetical protein